MINFGARLSLKDNMYATLQKNLKIQKQFSEQVSSTDRAVQGLGKRNVNPIIRLRDDVTAKVIGIRRELRAMSDVKALTKVEVEGQALAKAEEIENTLRRIGKMAVTPFVRLKDTASERMGTIKQKLKDIATNYTPIVKVRDLASQGLSKLKNTISWLKVATVTPAIMLKDKATSVVNKLKVNLSAIGKVTAKPFIAIKDKASPIVNKLKNTLKSVGKTVAKPFVTLKDGATKMLNGIKQGLKSVGSTVAKATVAIKDGATAGLSKIGGMLKSLAKGVTIGIGIAGAGLTALVGGAISEGASMEQSIGGVETLFGADAGAVIANANNAYKTAGISANEYMETVTSFSASLLQSLGGDTKKASAVADMALIDMADNANKFGTDMGSIQTAYQGFAKQNYTMLDNLKLGYGGTKEEMQRLLKDAQKLTGQKYDISNLNDVYSAIHAIQEDLGVTGTTAKEAGSTFAGSFSAMKASAKNLMAGLALGGDITPQMEQLIDSATTFLFDNALPMIGRIFESLPTAIGVAIEKGVPKLKQLGGTIANAIKEGLKSMLPAGLSEMVDPAFDGIGSAISKAVASAKSAMQSLLPAVTNILSTLAPVVGQIGDLFFETVPIIADVLGSAFGEGGGIVQLFADIVSSTIPVVKQVVMSLAQVFKAVIPALQPILSTLGTMIQTIFPIISNIISVFGDIIAQVFPVVASVVSMALNSIMPIIQALGNLIQTLLPVISNIISVVAGVIQTVLPVVSQIFADVGGKIAEIISGIVVPIVQKLGDIFQKIAPVIQSATEIISTVISTAWSIISPVLDLVISVFELVWSILSPIIDALVDAFVWLWDILEPIFSGLAEALSWVGDAIGSVTDWLGGAVDTVAGWFGFAYGKDRVPYDNYPAVLHQGEKVLTRNQADQYERAMSTRGVQLNNALQPVDSTLSNDNTGGIGSAGQPQEVKEISKAGATVNIEKLADTVVIEKEADVDKVVEDMVKKFRKLVPNMA